MVCHVRILGPDKVASPPEAWIETIDWLENELETRGWTKAELARRAKINQSGLSMLFSGARGPGVDICQSLARALHFPPEEVFRHAGLLPPKIDKSPLDSRIQHLVSALATEEDKRDVLAYVELRHRIAEERRSYETGKDEKRSKSIRP